MVPRISDWGLARHKAIGGYSLKQFSQPPDRRLPAHVHEDASLCFVVSGSYTETVRGIDTVCLPHSMVFKPALERHADRFGSLGGTCLLIELSPASLEAISPFAAIADRPRLTRQARLGACGCRLYEEFVHEDDCSSLVIEGLILEILGETARAVTGGRSTPPVWLQRARDLIHDRFREPLTLSSVARDVDIHPSHFARTFSRYYRTTVGEYVRRLRLEAASQRLVDSTMPLSEIALSLGFFDQSHFSRLFKQHTGLTPRQVRSTAQRGTRSSRT